MRYSLTLLFPTLGLSEFAFPLPVIPTSGVSALELVTSLSSELSLELQLTLVGVEKPPTLSIGLRTVCLPPLSSIHFPSSESCQRAHVVDGEKDKVTSR
jgi:hypothetical protein